MFAARLSAHDDRLSADPSGAGTATHFCLLNTALR